MMSEKFSRLDPLIHSRVRLAILSILASAEEADFNFLKETIGATDGNLSTHLAKLEKAGLISITKSFRGKKPLTTCVITEEGKESFLKYLSALEDYITIARAPRNTRKT